MLRKGGSITYFISDGNFELSRLNVSGKMPLEKGRMRIITPMAPCKITWEAGEMEVAPFATVLVPAGMEVQVEGRMNALMSSTSDQEALRAELGYRAERVAGLHGISAFSEKKRPF